MTKFFLEPVSHHTSVMYGNMMYLFGGINGIDSNEEFYQLDMESFKWAKLNAKQTGSDPKDWMKTRDEHAACVMENEMVVFGGFKEGERCNEIHTYAF